MALGRTRTPGPDYTAIRLAQLTAAVDQVLALCQEATTANRGNRELCNLALDIHNTLTINPDVPVTPGR